MPKVTVTGESQKEAKETFEKIKTMLESDSDLKKLDPGYACKFDESSLTGTATGNMFKAGMTVSSKGGGSSVEIIVDLPMKLALVKGLVRSTMQKKLDKVLSEA